MKAEEKKEEERIDQCVHCRRKWWALYGGSVCVCVLINECRLSCLRLARSLLADVRRFH